MIILSIYHWNKILGTNNGKYITNENGFHRKMRQMDKLLLLLILILIISIEIINTDAEDQYTINYNIPTEGSSDQYTINYNIPVELKNIEMVYGV